MKQLMKKIQKIDKKNWEWANFAFEAHYQALKIIVASISAGCIFMPYRSKFASTKNKVTIKKIGPNERKNG